jgi:hypothetical protein
MPNEEEKSFPKELIDKALKSYSSMWGWRFQDIPEVVEVCRHLGYSISGGTVIFILPNHLGVGEFYWLDALTEDRKVGKKWKEFVNRSCSEFLNLFNNLIVRTNFDKEIHEWNYLRMVLEAGVNVKDFLCLELYIYSESSYLKFKSKS